MQWASAIAWFPDGAVCLWMIRSESRWIEVVGMLRYGVVEVLVGVLVTGAVVVVGLFMVSRLSHEVGFYRDCRMINAHFANVDGLKIGNEVRVSGVNIGSVVSLRLDRDNVPLVGMCIQEEVALPRDSSATITYADLLGKKYIDIIPGSEETLVPEGGILQHTSTAVTLRMILEGLVSSVLRK
ncbi:MAG: MlaD family protein [Anaplasma sp.]